MMHISSTAVHYWLIFVVSVLMAATGTSCLNWGVEEPSGDGDADTDSVADAQPDGDGDADADGDGDADADGDRDEDVDEDVDYNPDADHEVTEPDITGIVGTGSAQEIAPRDEDRERWEGIDEGDRRPASRRISSETRDIVITGHNLGATERVVARPDDGSDPIEFGLEEVSMERVRARFPEDVSGTTLTALFTLAVTMSGGARAEAQVFFLQGQDCAASILDCADGTCTIGQNLEVEGDLSATGRVTGADGSFDSLEVESLTVTQSVWLPECPPGYERESGRTDIVLCQRDLGGGRYDEVVKVGDFWADRYESTVWADDACSLGIREGVPYGIEGGGYPLSFPQSGQIHDTDSLLFACSVSGVMPSTSLTWFQAQAACAASGKRLISNAEWQAAVVGTVDPGESGEETGPCLTFGSGPRATGGAGDAPGGEDSCVSVWGVEDMIGNVYEWTSDWWQAGLDWMTTDFSHAAAWPDGYSPDGSDVTGNLDGRAMTMGGIEDGLPAAAGRGGYWTMGDMAGAFNLGLGWAPSAAGPGYGFRCALSFSPSSHE